jgi:hypothetical protein
MQAPPQDPRNPRFSPVHPGTQVVSQGGHGFAPQPQSPYGMAQGAPSPYGAQQAPSPYGAQQAPSPYGAQQAPSPYGAPQGYGGPAPQAQPSSPPAPSPFSAAGFSVGMPHVPGLGSAGKALSGLPQPSGLPSGAAFGLGVLAVAIALVFDVIFLHVHIPGVGGYAWYLTTALSFAGAGFGGAKWTKAEKGTVTAAVVMAGVLYGLADVGLGLVLEDLAMGSALFLGIQGLVIAIVCGGAGMRKGLAARD